MAREGPVWPGRVWHGQGGSGTDREGAALPGRVRQDTHKPLINPHQGRDRPLSLGWGHSASVLSPLPPPRVCRNMGGERRQVLVSHRHRSLNKPWERPQLSHFQLFTEVPVVLKAFKNVCVTNPEDPVEPPQFCAALEEVLLSKAPRSCPGGPGLHHPPQPFGSSTI